MGCWASGRERAEGACESAGRMGDVQLRLACIPGFAELLELQRREQAVVGSGACAPCRDYRYRL